MCWVECGVKRFRFESFMRFIIQSPKYGTFTEAARTDLIWSWEIFSRHSYSYNIGRDEFINMEHTTSSLAQQLLWEYVQKYIDIKRGYLIADDTILDKPRGPKIEEVGFHYLKSFFIDQSGLRCRLKGLGIHRCFSQPSNTSGSKKPLTFVSQIVSNQIHRLMRMNVMDYIRAHKTCAIAS